jgi:hypothetical protein
MNLPRYGRSVKHDGKYRLQADCWRSAYDRSTSIRDRFPAVEELVVRVTFTDTQRFGTYSSLMHSFSPSARAFFAIACPRTLCLDGGFDLDATIVILLRSRRQVATGTMECAGDAQPHLADGRNCQLHMHYDVHVKYARSARRN